MSERNVSGRAVSQIGPAKRLEAVEPDDFASLSGGATRALFVGVGGVLRVEDAFGRVVSLVSASSQYHPISVVRVLQTGTTASGVVALY